MKDSPLAHDQNGWVGHCQKCNRLYWSRWIAHMAKGVAYELDEETPHKCEVKQ